MVVKKRNKWKEVSLILAFLGVLLLMPVTALAHPLGNFTINSYSRLDIGAEAVKLYYILDIAEIPTFQEKDRIDTDHNGQVSEAEGKAYLAVKIQEILPGLKLSVNGKPVVLKVQNQNLEFLPGQGGLQTMRLTYNLLSPPLEKEASTLAYKDENYSGRVGWKEVIVRNASGVTLIKSTVPNIDVSNELRTYPQDLLTSPLAVTSAQVTFRLDPSVVVKDPNSKSLSPSFGGIQNRGQDPFADLVNSNELTLPLILISLVFSFFWGALHAFSPGHGKTVVAAYLVGSRGTARHALFLGLIVTITHTLGVFALGLITLFAAQFIVPDKLYPWLGFISGLIVVVMGVNMVRSRLQAASTGGLFSLLNLSKTAVAPAPHYHRSEASHSHSDKHIHGHSDHEHGQNGHTHELGQNGHAHEHAPNHKPAGHNQANPEPDMAQTRGFITVPPVKNTFNTSSPESEHNHLPLQAGSLRHLESPEPEGHSPTPDLEGPSHSHNGVVHSHLPPGADGNPLTWKSLLSFGISAGLLPCPSALIVMLSTIALGRVAFGIVLIILFSLGLAVTLSGMGLLFVYARNWMVRLKFKPSGGLLKLAPIASALIITVLGVFISLEALIQTGLFNK